MPTSSPLAALHRELGARLTDFAGEQLPLHYPTGIRAEHLHCRAQAALFDVSHMGQLRIHGAGATAALEKTLPLDLEALPLHHQRYALLPNRGGGIIDDLLITRRGEEDYFLVVNAACQAKDRAHLQAHLADHLRLTEMPDQALLALQGPAAAAALCPLLPTAANLHFMQGCEAQYRGAAVYVTRSGYTGEDGFEVSLPSERAADFAKALLAQPTVQPAGLGARDSLRLEAGLCLYGQDIDEATNPIEAGLGWSISPARRAGGARAGGFIGAGAILQAQRDGPARQRVGLDIAGRVPVRGGALIENAQGQQIGRVTSGGFAPSLAGPIAMGYVERDHASPGTPLFALVRGKRCAAQACHPVRIKLNYHRGP